MADVDFGDSELFEQFDEVKPVQPTHIRFDVTEDSDEEVEALREQLVNCEETIRQLKAENQELRRKLNVLTRPSGLSVDDKLDGPLLQILFMNHVISKQYHQEVEDFVTSLAQKFEEQKKSNPEKNPFNIKPQPSSIFLEEKACINGVDSVKKIKEAFSVVGSVLYFTNFCLDKLGQPLLNENPQLTDGWEIPKYQQMFTQIVSLDGQEIQVKAKRPKPCCFNCGSEEHQMRDCPKPRDNAHINMKRKEFMDACGDSTNQNSQQRYHAEEVEERFGKFKPGFISDELQDALGISDKNLPPFIYRMRQLGYPPGWLKEAELETSGLSLYDGKDSSEGELEEAESKMRNQNVSYDVSKLINYPGFNISTPSGMSDDWRSFGSIPMQSAHQKDTFAGYLACNFPAQNLQTNQKRLSTSPNDSSDRKKQKLSGYMTAESPVDMDVESDLDTSCSSPSSKGFRFQPPLPPGSPCGTPPPLPRGTPPSTPPNFIPPPPPTPTPPPLPKGTPPPTPTGRSPVPQSKDNYKAMDAMDDDALTLEELEEQQRLIWAALENTESTHSDSPLTGNSVNSSPSRTDLNTASVANVPSQNVANSKESDVFLEAIAVDSDEEHPLTPEAEQSNEEKNNFSATQDDISTIKLSEDKSEDAAEEAVYVDPKNLGIPDMSKFAEGITPFEYDNMSESTGIYLRLRNVLKNSPRNQQKLQKQD